MNWFETYEESEKRVADYLNTIDNLKSFCREHGLSYLNILEINKNKTRSRYPNLVKKVLEIMGFKVEQRICFELKDIEISDKMQ